MSEQEMAALIRLLHKDEVDVHPKRIADLTTLLNYVQTNPAARIAEVRLAIRAAAMAQPGNVPPWSR